jgi:hypothetical protein
LAIDLSGTLPSDIAVLHTVKPGTNVRTGWDITFAGPGHPQTVALNNKRERERLHKAANIERSQINGRKWKGDDDKDPQESRRDFLTDLTARIVSWTPVDFGTGEVKFESPTDAPNAVELLMNPHLGTYVSQMVDFLLDEQAFLTDSATG